MNDIIQYKSVFGTVKDIDFKNRIVTGILSSFGNKDYDGDIIVKGAYKKSISERKNDIFFLNQHDWKQPHGKFNVLEEKNEGLYFESTPLLDTTYSMDALKLYEAGIVKEHSVGFSTITKEYSREDGANILKEIKLYEGSNVTLGANSNTPFSGFKSLSFKEVKEQHKIILKAFRNGTFTDETFGLLEIALKELQTQAYELGVKSLSNKEPLIVDTPLIVEPKANVDTINNFIKSLK